MLAGLHIAALVILLFFGQSSQPNSRNPTTNTKPPPSRSTRPSIYVGSILGGRITHYVRPVYPAWARKQHAQGEIEFSALIGKEGQVRKLTFIRGLKPLAPYAEAAVRQWRYEPVKVNGIPVQFITEVILEVSFRR